jgi:hypothetical protein
MAEEWMSRLQCRGSIARAAVVVALLSSSPADAQVGVDPGPPRESGCLWNALVTGVQYDIVNQALAERRLQKLQAKLRYDAERGDVAAVDRDVCRIDNVKYRIVIDEWLIRWNSLQNPGFYPIRTNAVSRAAIAQATHPFQASYPSQLVSTPGPMAAAPTIPITIVNAEPTGAGVAFAIDGVAHQAAAGSRQDLAVAPGSTITYDSGGSFGQRRYRISPGLYEFRSTAEGWALYKVAGMP